jgi:hypothetical protein
MLTIKTFIKILGNQAKTISNNWLSYLQKRLQEYHPYFVFEQNEFDIEKT